MLAEIYGWFTEGFDTVGLQEAKALLEELRGSNHGPLGALLYLGIAGKYDTRGRTSTQLMAAPQERG